MWKSKTSQNVIVARITEIFDKFTSTIPCVSGFSKFIREFVYIALIELISFSC